MMLELLKTFPIEPSTYRINQLDELMSWGSCFANHLSEYLLKAGFIVHPSPYGIVYNPMSMAMGLERILDDAPIREDELLYHAGRFYDYMYHGTISSVEKSELIAQKSERQRQAKKALARARFLVLTWGTAYVYYKRDTGMVVNNCHKQSEHLFFRERMSVDAITSVWENLMHKLQKHYPKLKIILTVSPIRHYRDGIHANNLSKSTLLLATDYLVKAFPNVVHYFPSYEIVLDELRDYRFYAEDMVHPSGQAVSYVMQRFWDAYVDESSKPVAEAYKKAYQHSYHRAGKEQEAKHQEVVAELFLKAETERQRLKPLHHDALK